MSTATVEQRVVSVIREVLRVDPANIMPLQRIKEDLGADSLDQVTLIMAIEDEFNGAITDEEAVGMVTVADVVKFIEKQGAMITV